MNVQNAMALVKLLNEEIQHNIGNVVKNLNITMWIVIYAMEKVMQNMNINLR